MLVKSVVDSVHFGYCASLWDKVYSLDTITSVKISLNFF